MVERYTLKNGIPIFIVENHASPVVSVQAWVSRGSVYETEKVAGISHFLEHSLFKGTKKRKVGEIALEIESRGGEINAFTSFEETVYYTTLASRYFEDGLDVITDAVQNPLFDAEEMLREREVILEEIKRAQDSPYKMVSTNLWKTCFAGTPYGRPVLGYNETVAKIDHKTLRKYFNENYHAGTVSLFIVGDVDKKYAFDLAKTRLSKMKTGKKVKIPEMKNRSSSKTDIALISRDVTECQMVLAWPGLPIQDPNVPVLDVMCTAIGHGESSPLYQRLVKQTQIALEAHMGLVATAKCGLANISLEASPEHLHSALKETLVVLEETAANGLRDEDIERVKSSLEAEVIGGKETVEGYARRLGYYYIQFGDPEYEKKYLEKVLAVEKEGINLALNRMLESKPVLSMVHPNKMTVDQKELKEILAGVKKKRSTPVSVAHTLELKKKDTIRYVEKRVDSLPIVALRMIFPGGSREDGSKHGLSNLFQRLWTSGTPSYQSKQIAHTLDSLGASLHAFAGKHTIGLSLEFLPKHWAIVKPLLTEILLSPVFPDDEFLTEKNLLLRDIMSERDTPGSVCQLNFIKSLYKNHPYGRSSYGSAEAVTTLTPQDLRNYYRDFVHQKHAILSTVGYFPKETWADELHQLMKKLPASGRDSSAPFKVESITRPQFTLEKKTPLFQSHLLVGFLAADFNDPDRLALKLLSSCLAGQGGRLFLELRDKQSLAYSVAPLSSETPERGMFGFYIGCSPEKLLTAVTGIRGEIDKVVTQSMKATELDRAKKYWIGRFELEMQRFGSQAMLYGLDEIYGLGHTHALHLPEKIKAITADQIRNAAARFLTPDRATFSIVHNEELAQEAVFKAWEGKATAKTVKAIERTVSRSA